ncbi:MAG TPA: FAD-binding protein [Ohtaekwangia sp.]|nr:FAD-binding protein [Ohtaekwangia sp.]
MAQIISTGNDEWQNRHMTFREDIDDLLDMWNGSSEDIIVGYNRMSAAIQEHIGNAIQAGKPIRALGGGWTWTRIATCNKGRMYNTKGLNWRFSISPSQVEESYPGSSSDLLFVQCGVSIHELNGYLKRRNKALKTSGASNGQTIVGAMSTGTHGSAFDFGAVQDFVVGLHIITGPDKNNPAHNVYLERESYKVTKASLALKLNAQLIRNDALFNAAVVSFGSFGFIHGVMIETEPLYLLECYRQREKDPRLRHLLQTLDFSPADFLPYGSEHPHHFQVTFNPHDMDDGAYVTTMYKRPYIANSYTPPGTDSGIGPGDDAPAFIGLISDAVPHIVPTIVNGLVKRSYKTYANVRGTRGEIFGDTELRGKLISSAMGIPLAEVNKVVDIMLALNADPAFGPFAGVYALRFVKATQATLGFTCFGPQTCVLELDCVWSARMLKFIEEAWKRLDEAQVPFTFHWGKQCGVTPPRMLHGYGQHKIDAWKQARNTLLDEQTRNIFNNDQIKQWSLHV